MVDVMKDFFMCCGMGTLFCGFTTNENSRVFERVRWPDRFASRMRLTEKRHGTVHNGIVYAWIDVDDIDLFQHSFGTEISRYLLKMARAKFCYHQVRTIWGLSYDEV